MNRLFVESSSSSSGSGGCREAEPVLCAPRPRRAQVHPCSADLILGPPPFLLNSNKVLESRSNSHQQPLFFLLSLQKLLLHPFVFVFSYYKDLIFFATLQSKEGGETKAPEGDEDGGWALFGGSPPARADNPLVHDPHFLLNQRHPAVVVDSPLELGIFDHQSRSNYGLRPTYISSSSNSSSNSFAPSFAPAVRIQGFDVAACRSSHSNAGGRVLSARA
ncbi:unnamed protein product [Urochloa decumbens]|uniref:Uncharacterized protein n=1 Tax=Urochloa decumbens TaxID=240449 RepID=A0ABC8YM49_9POAL